MLSFNPEGVVFQLQSVSTTDPSPIDPWRQSGAWNVTPLGFVTVLFAFVRGLTPTAIQCHPFRVGTWMCADMDAIRLSNLTPSGLVPEFVSAVMERGRGGRVHSGDNNPTNSRCSVSLPATQNFGRQSSI